ncbi:DUF3237 domain-containing protein [Microbacterium sp. GXF7504]
MAITTEHLFTLDVDIAPPREVGAVHGGTLRVIPITGGRVHGPRLSGEVLPGGADWNTMRDDGCVHVWARYEIRTDDGHVVSIVNEGLAPIDRTAAAPPALLTRPVFTVAEGGPSWLTTTALIGVLRPTGGATVSIEVHGLDAGAPVG